MDNSLISVIIPVYRADEVSLRRSIDSVLAQTYVCLELILVDDGSPDNCGDICEEYILRDERVHVIHKENGGVSSARNAGLLKARGDYISFVDSDDFVDSNYLELLLYILQKEKSDIAICCCYTDGESYVNKNNIIRKYNKNKALDLLTYNRHIFHNCETNCVWGKLYKRDVINNTLFDEKMCIAEDYIFNYFVINNTQSVSFINKQLYHYTSSPASISNSGAIEKYIKSFDALISYDKNKGMINRIVNIAFWILLQSKDTSQTNNVKIYIKNNYLTVFFDHKSSLKTRIAIIAYLFGESFLRKIYKYSNN